MEQTKSNAGAFVDAAKLQMDGGFRNITNNIAFELFGDGTGARGTIGTVDSSGSASGIYVITLSNINNIVQFEVNMTLVNFTASSSTISSISSTQGLVTAVDRANGIITILTSTAGADSSWATAGKKLGIYGDIVSGSISTGTNLCLSGLAAWVPTSTPTSTPFWGVDRSTDATRLGGLRYDASSMTIEEGMTNALAFMNREGAKPDLCIMDFASYAALVNALGRRILH